MVSTPSLDIRLDAEHQRKLGELSRVRRSTAEDVIGDLIDQGYDQVDAARRLGLVAEIGQLAIENPPDPAIMSAQLAAAHGRLDLP